MSNRTPKGIQLDTIDRYSEPIQESFDLDRFDDFTTGLGVEFYHFKAMISPAGKKDRGDYRRSDGVDTITSNGMIYRCAGKFTATMTDNSRSKRRGDSGTLDPSESRLVLPRFYNNLGVADGKRIYLAPGDRIYVADPLADVLVSNYQMMDFETGENAPMFPISELEQPIVDSRNIEYQPGVDFNVSPQGNITWIAGGKNPGIDPDTGKGRIYSIRYLYKAFWYVTSLPKEIRVTNVTSDDGQRSPQRMPYNAMVTREYIFHQRNKGDQTNQLKPKDKARTVKAPVEPINPSKYPISVDMTAIDDGDEQS